MTAESDIHTLRTEADLDTVDFSKQGGLVPVVAQDAESGEVLMVAFANRAAVARTLESGEMHFWSRSRQKLWRKGESSGHTLALVSLRADCDRDTLLAAVRPAGPACHTGARTCFGDGAAAKETSGATAGEGRDPLDVLDVTLATRAEERPEGSYTVRLLEDSNLRLKKLGEESAELVAALATRDRERAVQEAADLVFHILVGLRAEGLGLEALRAALAARVR